MYGFSAATPTASTSFVVVTLSMCRMNVKK